MKVEAALKAPYELIRRWLGMPFAVLFHALGVTANQMTVSRFLSPFILWPLHIWQPIGYQIYTFGAFVILSWTDLLDGLMSGLEGKSDGDIGAVLDPLADKILITATYVLFFPAFPYLVSFTLGGEALLVAVVLGYRAFASTVGEEFNISKIRANIWGKWKFGMEAITGATMLLHELYPVPMLEGVIVVIGSLAITLLLLSLLTKVRDVIG